VGISERQTGTNDEWCTPPEVYEPILEHFGAIALDPCGHPNQMICAREIHLLEEYEHIPLGPVAAAAESIVIVPAGFSTPWIVNGLTYLNGPFSILGKYAQKAYEEPSEIIHLMPVRTGNQWWKHWTWRHDYICFWYGRMKFVGAKFTAPTHHCLAYKGDRGTLFKEAFRGKGHFVRKG